LKRDLDLETKFFVKTLETNFYLKGWF